jgi:isopentenyl diphosphate isomerase/L-lactate dehydrogenase-like FMN-dependent dehydrogenase
VLDNVYYVGTKTLSSFLIVTPAGNILMDTTYERNVRTIQKSVEQLGFKFSDTKIILGNHAHVDHMEGDALAKELTGAQVIVMAEDVPALKALKPDLFDKLRKITTVKLLLKRVETGENAKTARDHGVDGIIVSNHGGRATETLRPTIESLPEVIEAVGNQIPVLVDGGVRRGSSAFKALAMGARAVGVGRPYVWGLASFGQPGVERVIDILRGELVRTMQQCGTPTIAQITRSHVTSVRS